MTRICLRNSVYLGTGGYLHLGGCAERLHRQSMSLQIKAGPKIKTQNTELNKYRELKNEGLRSFVFARIASKTTTVIFRGYWQGAQAPEQSLCFRSVGVVRRARA